MSGLFTLIHFAARFVILDGFCSKFASVLSVILLDNAHRTSYIAHCIHVYAVCSMHILQFHQWMDGYTCINIQCMEYLWKFYRRCMGIVLSSAFHIYFIIITRMKNLISNLNYIFMGNFFLLTFLHFLLMGFETMTEEISEYSLVKMPFLLILWTKYVHSKPKKYDLCIHFDAFNEVQKYNPWTLWTP